ncbi:MAG: hypothetical protein ACK5U4_19005 [Rhodospirillales bacterium]|jgi:hypothetical protein
MVAKTSHVDAAAADPAGAGSAGAGSPAAAGAEHGAQATAGAPPASTRLSRQIEATTQRLQEANKRRKAEAKRILTLTPPVKTTRRWAQIIFPSARRSEIARVALFASPVTSCFWKCLADKQKRIQPSYVTDSKQSDHRAR